MNKFQELFARVGKTPYDRKVKHFHSPLKLVQAKGRRVTQHLLAGVNKELRRMETEGHIRKLDDDCFNSPIVITRKMGGSNKLALDSKLLNDQIFKKNQMLHIRELIDNLTFKTILTGAVENDRIPIKISRTTN